MSNVKGFSHWSEVFLFFFYENAFAFNVADSPCFPVLVDQCQPDRAYAQEHIMIPPHVVTYRIACRRGARMRARAARICAQAQRARSRAQARDTVRAWRAAPERDSRAYQPSPRIRPGKKSSGV